MSVINSNYAYIGGIIFNTNYYILYSAFPLSSGTLSSSYYKTVSSGSSTIGYYPSSFYYATSSNNYYYYSSFEPLIATSTIIGFTRGVGIADPTILYSFSFAGGMKCSGLYSDVATNSNLLYAFVFDSTNY